MDTNIPSINTRDPNQINDSPVDMHTLEENTVSKVRSEVDSVMTTVETTVQDEVMSAIESLVFPRVELALKSVIAPSGHRPGSVMLDPDQRDFPGIIEGLQITVSSRINSHTYLNRIDETRGNFAVEGSVLLVDGRNVDL